MLRRFELCESYKFGSSIEYQLDKFPKEVYHITTIEIEDASCHQYVIEVKQSLRDYRKGLTPKFIHAAKWVFWADGIRSIRLSHIHAERYS